MSAEDVLGALKKHFLPLFDASTSVAAVVTAPAQAGEIVEGLTAVGFEVEQRSLEVSPEDMEGSESGSDSEDSDEDSEED